MTTLERRLTKLEQELDALQQGKMHLVFADDDGNYQQPPDFKDGVQLIIVRWVKPGEEIPGTE